MLAAFSGRRPLAARIAQQGAVLIGGFGLSQALSFLRNAMIGHALSRGDFGIAAGITMVLQMVDQLSEVGADRLLVQASDGGEARFIGTAHAVSAARGLANGLIIMLVAGLAADFLMVPAATWAFAATGITPMLRGFTHLATRRAQRTLDNRAIMIVEILPQAAALAATPLVLAFDNTYAAVLWLAVLQALATIAASHALAETPYRLCFDRDVLSRLAKFGWPIWLSGIPLIAVYQGDRMLVGRMFGIEALAAYSAAFMITMVPGLLAAKVGNALMLPLFADARDGPDLRHRFGLISEATALAGAAYLTLFIALGEHVMTLAFGKHYAGLGSLTCWLAAMWTVRMVQAVPGMVLMAEGVTRPLLAAGVARALALPVAIAAAWLGAGIETIVAIGALGELASLLYIAGCVEERQGGFARILLLRTVLIMPFAVVAAALKAVVPTGGGILAAAGVAAAVLALIAAAGVATAPGLRAMARTLWPQRQAA